MRSFSYVHSGIVTLTLLLLLSASLFILLLLDDDMLRLHSALSSQREHYARQSIALQRLSQNQKDDICATIAKDNNSKVQRIEFLLPDSPNTYYDDNRQYVWCERHFLFQTIPTKAILEREFSTYIDVAKIAQFTFSPPPLVQKKDTKNRHFYRFAADQTQWELAGDVYAVVIAEGNLHISGKGRLRGSVITVGDLSYDDEITLAYNKNTVTEIVQKMSYWQRAEKSWHDFEALQP